MVSFFIDLNLFCLKMKDSSVSDYCEIEICDLSLMPAQFETCGESGTSKTLVVF